MWTEVSKQTPKADHNYEVYGIVNLGTKHETKQQFQAYFNTETQRWENHNWDDINPCEHDVKFWFDFDQVKEPM